MIDADELVLFEASLRRATETATGDALDAVLDDLGWYDALVDDRRAAIALLFELQGRAGATSAALDHVLANALGVDRTSVAAIVLPKLGRVEAPGRRVGEAVDIDGVALGSAARRAELVVGLQGGEGMARVSADALERRSARGLDPALGLVEVHGTGVPAVVEPAPAPRPAAWPDAVAVGQVALAHELIGVSRAMLELARGHALERIQFGQPIAQFQAVRHRLADTFVAIESAEAVTHAAWDDGSALAAAAAKAVAGRSARLAARHCQQVLAGIGFTAEHPLHGYVRRVVVLDRLLGDTRSLTIVMGDELLRTREVPALRPL